jgi:ABC-type transport system involved in cytochrome c biogenesis permease subunit
MASLFALGIMSIPWMVVIAAFIGAEKLLPWRRTAMGAVTIALLVLGLAVALVPERVPWLMTPSGGIHEMTAPEMAPEMEMPT